MLSIKEFLIVMYHVMEPFSVLSCLAMEQELKVTQVLEKLKIGNEIKQDEKIFHKNYEHSVINSNVYKSKIN